MRVEDLATGWRTNCILPRFDAQLIERDDCLVVRTPQAPTFYWGNCLVLPQAPADGELAHWRARFHEEIGAHQPASRHMAIGVDAPAAGEALPSWAAGGFERFDNTTLELRPGELQPPARPARGDVAVRPLDLAASFDAVLALQNADHRGYEPTGHALFRRHQLQRYAAMAAAGRATWFGAWCDGVLAADCGLMRDGALGRFQYVQTHPDWRRRGLCGTLIHAVSDWAFTQAGLQQLIMAADPGDVAIGIYQSLGYRAIGADWGLQRRPTEDGAWA